MTNAGPGQTQELEASSGSLTWVPGTRDLDHLSLLFQGALAGSCIASGIAKIWDVAVAHYATMPTAYFAFFFSWTSLYFQRLHSP